MILYENDKTRVVVEMGVRGCREAAIFIDNLYMNLLHPQD
tara:strand:+ start:386 stop:505 length:120 start_codon:yes stop_codon:yes gene_type:complete